MDLRGLVTVLALVFDLVESREVIVKQTSKINAQQVLPVGLQISVQLNDGVLELLVLIEVKDFDGPRVGARQTRELNEAQSFGLQIELVSVQCYVVGALAALNTDDDLEERWIDQ